MSLLSALSDQENTADQGWSQSSMFNNESQESNIWPQCSTTSPSVEQLEISTINDQIIRFDQTISQEQQEAVSQISHESTTSHALQESVEGTNISTVVCSQTSNGESILRNHNTVQRQALYSPAQKKFYLLPELQTQEKPRSLIKDLLVYKSKNLPGTVVNNCSQNNRKSVYQTYTGQSGSQPQGFTVHITKQNDNQSTQSQYPKIVYPSKQQQTFLTIQSPQNVSQQQSPKVIVQPALQSLIYPQLASITNNTVNSPASSGSSIDVHNSDDSYLSPELDHGYAFTKSPSKRGPISHSSQGFSQQGSADRSLLLSNNTNMVFKSYNQEMSQKANTKSEAAKPPPTKVQNVVLSNASDQMHTYSLQSYLQNQGGAVTIHSNASNVDQLEQTSLSVSGQNVVYSVSSSDNSQGMSSSDHSQGMSSGENSQAVSSDSQVMMCSLESPVGAENITSDSSQQVNTGSDSSSLTPVTTKNIVLPSGRGLEKNMRYVIKTKAGDLTMIWDGSQLIEVPKDDDHLNGGGKKNKSKERHLKGNATGLNMGYNNQNVTVVRKKSEERILLPNGRPWLHADAPGRNSLERRPLHQGKSTGAVVVQSSQEEPSSTTSSSQDSSLESSQESQKSNSKSTFKRQYNEDGEELVVLCKFCGYTSDNCESCERCNRSFPVGTVPQPKRQKMNTVATETKSEGTSTQTLPTVLSKQSFYSKKIREQSQAYSRGTSLLVKGIGRGGGRKISNKGTSYKMVAVRKKPMEPVTVTISSDEDEDMATSNTTSTDQDSREQKSQETHQDDENDELSKLVSVLPQRSSSPKFKCSRLNKMEDREGKTLKLGVQEKKKTEDTESEEPNPPKEETAKSIPDIQFSAKSVCIGSLKGVPVEPVFITDTGISLYIECEKNTYRFSIQPEHILQCMLHFSREQSMIFLSVSTDFAQQLRKELEMNDNPPSTDSVTPYFNPTDEDLKHRYIKILPQNLNPKLTGDLTSMLESYKAKHSFEIEHFVQSLNAKDAKQLLTDSDPSAKRQVDAVTNGTCRNLMLTKNILQNNKKQVVYALVGGKLEDGNLTLTPIEPTNQEVHVAHSGFTGPVEKIVTYPPSTGGIAITNEDLYCLNEGEFLNDVIIDFFLKYLCLDVLKEEDRNRTHVFSSFFFKCLTQRQGRSLSSGETSLTPAEKRHARVKKWTKHVDLFEKDFIIVPINEHSHWFLAIICYPGLKEIQPVHYLPRRHVQSAVQETPQTESPAKPAEDGSDSEMQGGDDRQETPMDTSESSSLPQTLQTPQTPQTPSVKLPSRELRGHIVEDAETLTPEEKKFLQRGQRQPCIMVFDSLAGQSKSRIVNILKEYLQVEWKMKKQTPCNLKERIRGCSPKVPQQSNFSDCGVYVLQYAQSFFEDPVIDYTFPIKCLQNWFDETVINRKRKEIHDLVMDLKKRYEEGKS